jgi:hypothetical protein
LLLFCFNKDERMAAFNHPHPHHMLDKSESMVTITQVAKGSGRPTSFVFSTYFSRWQLTGISLGRPVSHSIETVACSKQFPLKGEGIEGIAPSLSRAASLSNQPMYYCR